MPLDSISRILDITTAAETPVTLPLPSAPVCSDSSRGCGCLWRSWAADPDRSDTTPSTRCPWTTHFLRCFLSVLLLFIATCFIIIIISIFFFGSTVYISTYFEPPAYLWWFSSTLSGDVAKRRSHSWMMGLWSSSDARHSCVATSGCHDNSLHLIYKRRSVIGHGNTLINAQQQCVIASKTPAAARITADYVNWAYVPGTCCRIFWWWARFCAGPRPRSGRRKLTPWCAALDGSSQGTWRHLVATWLTNNNTSITKQVHRVYSAYVFMPEFVCTTAQHLPAISVLVSWDSMDYSNPKCIFLIHWRRMPASCPSNIN